MREAYFYSHFKGMVHYLNGDHSGCCFKNVIAHYREVTEEKNVKYLVLHFKPKRKKFSSEVSFRNSSFAAVSVLFLFLLDSN